MMTAELNNIRGLIATMPVEEIKLTNIPTSYAMLQRACIQLEVNTEKANLDELFNSESDEDVLKVKFKELCQVRYRHIRSTALSYEVVPNSLCNQVYWQIASQLFAPANLSETLAILMPDIRVVLFPEFDVMPRANAPSVNISERVNVRIDRENVSTGLQGYDAGLAALSMMVVANDAIMPLAPFTRLSYDLYSKLHESLSEYPAIRDNFYNHNQTLRKLGEDIREHYSLREALSALYFDLSRSGEKFTGRDRAGSRAESAVARFQHYLDRYTPLMRDILSFALEDRDGRTLAEVMEDYIEHDQCTDLTSDSIKEIREICQNQALISQLPTESKEYRLNIARHYRQLSRTTGLHILRDESLVIAMPRDLRVQSFKHIVIQTADDCLDLLLYLPPSEYITVISYATIILPVLTAQLASTMQSLNHAQRYAWMDVMKAKPSLFGGLVNVIWFVIAANDSSLWQYLVQAYQQPMMVAEDFKSILISNRIFLHIAASAGNKEVALSILRSYPEQNRLNALISIIQTWDTALHVAVFCEKKEFILSILAELNNADQIKVISQRNYDNKSVLYCAVETGQHELVHALLQLYGENERINAINSDHNSNDMSLLQIAARNRNVELVLAILQACPQSDRKWAVSAKNNEGQNALFYAAYSGNLELVMMLLNVYPENDRCRVIKDKNMHGETILAPVAMSGNKELMLKLLEFYPEQERFTVMNEESSSSNSVLYWLEHFNKFDIDSFLLDSLKAYVIRELLKKELPDHPCLTLRTNDLIESITTNRDSQLIAAIREIVNQTVTRYDQNSDEALTSARAMFEAQKAAHGKSVRTSEEGIFRNTRKRTANHVGHGKSLKLRRE